MKLNDIVKQLTGVIPKYTSLLSNTIAIASIQAGPATATIATTGAHGLSDGAAITIADVQFENRILSITQSGNIFGITTVEDHDLTYGWEEHTTIELEGFTDPAWNDSFTLLSVPNRKQFTIRSTNSAPVLNGNEVLLENRMDGVNGKYAVTVLNTVSFTITGQFNSGVYTGGSVVSAVRIAGTATIERAIDQYTEQNLTDIWAIVVMKDGEVSKDRESYSDAVSTKVTADDMRLRLLDGFTINLIKNTSDEIAGENSIDIFRHTLLLPILKSVFGIRFDSGLSGDTDFKTVLTSHGLSLYNKAYMVYTYDFECVFDLSIGDTVEDEDTRAFRDVEYTESMGDDDVTDMTVNIDLDEEPL